MKCVILLASLGLFSIGCTPAILQVVTLRGSNVKPTSAGLVLDNDTLTLQYNFASERGLMRITLVNKLDQPLYVDWQRSSFIINQKTFIYWDDVASVNLVSSGYVYRYRRSSLASLQSSTSGTIAKEVPSTFIPPHSKITKQRFVVFPEGVVPTTGPSTERREQARWTSNPKKGVNVTDYSYLANQSPLRFRNYLTLSTNKSFTTDFGIDTQFWASSVRVEPALQAVDVVRKMPNGSYANRRTFSQRDGFYVRLP